MSVPHLHFEEVGSTLDVARENAALPGNRDVEFVLITAAAQTRGRGTRGRPWQSPPGNVHLTLAIHRKFLPPARLKLFPLEAALALWDAAAPLLPPQSRAGLRLKWPNDLLFDGRKTAGMLLEAAGDHVFVGVGVNVVLAPPIADGGTPSACLADAGAAPDCGPLLAQAFADALQARLEGPFDAARAGILEEWRAKALWDKALRLRDRPDRPEVLPIDVDAEGHLKVRFPDGREEWLVSEYLA